MSEAPDPPSEKDPPTAPAARHGNSGEGAASVLRELMRQRGGDAPDPPVRSERPRPADSSPPR